MNISFDFDNTLENPELQDVAYDFIAGGNTVFIITSRFEKHDAYDNQDIIHVAKVLGIKPWHIIFTNGKSKADAIAQNNISIHFEDCPTECKELKDFFTNVVQVVPFIRENQND